MKEQIKYRIHRLNTFLNRPTTIIMILVFLFVFFAYGNAQFEKENKQLLLNTKQSADNSNAILKNLQQAVYDLKADNERQTRFISCLLALHGEGQLVSDDVRAQCEKMSTNVDMTDISKSSQPSSSPSTQSQTSTPTSNPPANNKPIDCKVNVLFIHINCK